MIGILMRPQRLVVVTFAVLLSGCSSSSPDEPGLPAGPDGASAVINAWSRAMINGDGPRACSLMDKEAQAALTMTSQATDCLQAVSVWDTKNSSAQVLESQEADIRVNDDTASYTVQRPNSFPSELTHQGELRLRRIEERWTIVSPVK